MISFADDPADHFKFDLHAAHHQQPSDMKPLQLEAARKRFADGVEHFPPLAALAEHRDVSEIGNHEDLAKVLFHHTLFKSYPEEALFAGDFDTLTDWLGNFTTNDLSVVRSRDFNSLDAWLDALNTDTAMHVLHSSGTTGQLSFMPRGELEHQFSIRHTQMCLAEIAKPGRFERNAPDFKVVWPAYAGGWSGVLSLGETFRDVLCASEDDYHPLIPDRLSADHQLYLMQIENARLAGEDFIDAPSDHVQEAIDRSLAFRASEAQRMEELLDNIQSAWRGRKIVYAGGPVLLYAMSKAGLARGMEGALAEGSRIITFGGFKGVSPVGDEEAVIKRFSGVPRIQFVYGMSELTTAFLMCESGHYHIPPWIIPFVLDEATGDPKPLEGTQTGIAAFMDLTTRTYWGGLISADRVTISWERCACGRTTPYMKAEVERVEA